VTDVDSSSRGEVQPYIRPDSEIVREMRALRGFIDEARSARTLDPLFGYLYDAIERRTPEQVWTEAACGPRCAWCCHTRVSATAPEILFLARNLPTGVTDGIPALARRRREGWDKPLLESLAPRAVLADGLCTAHPSRPIVCRTTMSLDADQCRLACSLPDEAVIPSALASVALRAAYEIALRERSSTPVIAPTGSILRPRLPMRFRIRMRIGVARRRRRLSLRAPGRTGRLSRRAGETRPLRGSV
jgi:hypothetical protein